MVDPLSVTVGVLSLTRLALQSSIETKSFIDGIQGAPQSVKNLSNDSEALYAVLAALEKNLKDIAIDATPAQAAFVPLLQAPLTNCVSAFKEIRSVLNPFIKSSGEAKKSKWRGLVWTFREKRISVLQNALDSTKMSLDIAVSVANMSNNKTEFHGLREGIEGLQQRLVNDHTSLITTDIGKSDNAGSDYGFPLRKFLQDAETVFIDPPPKSTSFDAPSAESLLPETAGDISREMTNYEASVGASSRSKLEVGAPVVGAASHPPDLLMDRSTPITTNRFMPAVLEDDISRSAEADVRTGRLIQNVKENGLERARTKAKRRAAGAASILAEARDTATGIGRQRANQLEPENSTTEMQGETVLPRRLQSNHSPPRFRTELSRSDRTPLNVARDHHSDDDRALIVDETQLEACPVQSAEPLEQGEKVHEADTHALSHPAPNKPGRTSGIESYESAHSSSLTGAIDFGFRSLKVGPGTLHSTVISTAATREYHADLLSKSTRPSTREERRAQAIKEGRRTHVLFVAVSVFELSFVTSLEEAGFPSLTYVKGEIFDVIGARNGMWLARNQINPQGRVGWIWLADFMRLA